MKSRYLPLIVFLLLGACHIGQVAWYLPDLPARVAIHFDAAGKPNGWWTSTGVLTAAAVEIAITAVMFATAGLLRLVPADLVNVPNKAYWLAPERREATFAFVRDWMRWLVVLALAFLTAISNAALRANLTKPPHLDPVWIWLAAVFAIAVVAMIVVLIRHFRTPRLA
jgi:serine/threonine-protein kinase